VCQSKVEHECGEHCSHRDHQHDQSIHTITLVEPRPLELRRFELWLAKILWEKESADVFRMKVNIHNIHVTRERERERGDFKGSFCRQGVVSVSGSDEKHMLQSVHTLFEVQPSCIPWGQNEKRESKIVIIGRNLHSLAESFRREVLLEQQ
jgi:G3E family GTPase